MINMYLLEDFRKRVMSIEIRRRRYKYHKMRNVFQVPSWGERRGFGVLEWGLLRVAQNDTSTDARHWAGLSYLLTPEG
jgi:hypothetical protein